MRVIIGFATAATCLLLAQPAAAQSHSLAGILNLRTGMFEIRPNASPDVATTLYSGTFDVTLTLTIVSTIPTSQGIMCSTSITATDSTFSSHIESASVLAVRTGSTAVCTLTVPYAWSLATTPTYSFGYSVTTAASTGVPARESDFYPGTTTAVPAKGTTTKLAAAITL